MFAFSLRQIEVFLRVCETGSFRRAADLLGVSEASVSKQIRSLEGQLDCQLFERRRGTAVHLSPTGLTFLEGARAFASLGVGLGQSVRSGASQEKKLSVFVGSHILEDFIRPALPEFARRHPGVAFSFVPMPSRAEARKAALSGKLDGVLMTVESERDLPGSIFLADVEVAVYGSAALLKHAERDGLKGIPLIFPARESEEEAEVIKYLRSVGIPSPNVAGRYQYHDVGVGMALRGLGGLITLQSIADVCDPAAELCVLNPIATLQRRFYLQRSVDRHTAEVVAELFHAAAGPRAPRKRRGVARQ